MTNPPPVTTPLPEPDPNTARTRRRARLVFAASVALVIAALTAWAVGSGGEPRADLEGAAVRPATTVVAPTTTAPPTAAAVPTTVPSVPGVPTRISIPSLGVDAPVAAVGLARNGSMDVPKATEAGWYQYGPRPGEGGGSAVIAAHVDYNGVRGVFFDLRALATGAEVLVADTSGATHRYVVSQRFQVDKTRLRDNGVFRADGPAVLTLITCGGAFNDRARSYRDNIVVEAVPA